MPEIYSTYSWDWGFGGRICHKVPPLNRGHAPAICLVTCHVALLWVRILGHGDQQVHHGQEIDNAFLRINLVRKSCPATPIKANKLLG